MAGLASDLWGMETVCLYVGEAEPICIQAELKDSSLGSRSPGVGLVAGLPYPMGNPIGPGRLAGSPDPSSDQGALRGRNAAASESGSAAIWRLKSSVPYP